MHSVLGEIDGPEYELSSTLCADCDARMVFCGVCEEEFCPDCEHAGTVSQCPECLNQFEMAAGRSDTP